MHCRSMYRACISETSHSNVMCVDSRSDTNICCDGIKCACMSRKLLQKQNPKLIQGLSYARSFSLMTMCLRCKQAWTQGVHTCAPTGLRTLCGLWAWDASERVVSGFYRVRGTSYAKGTHTRMIPKPRNLWVLSHARKSSLVCMMCNDI